MILLVRELEVIEPDSRHWLSDLEDLGNPLVLLMVVPAVF